MIVCVHCADGGIAVLLQHFNGFVDGKWNSPPSDRTFNARLEYLKNVTFKSPSLFLTKSDAVKNGISLFGVFQFFGTEAFRISSHDQVFYIKFSNSSKISYLKWVFAIFEPNNYNYLSVAKRHFLWYAGLALKVLRIIVWRCVHVTSSFSSPFNLFIHLSDFPSKIYPSLI